LAIGSGADAAPARSAHSAWIALELTEGKNRQVRRMTAAVGHPTLRLVRARIGGLTLAGLELKPGAWREVDRASVLPPRSR
jgi:23S rRNA pseudouridine2457 synthase